MLAGGGIPSVASYDLQDRIAGFARVCSYDRAGLGWSDPALEPMSLTDQTTDLDRLLDGGGVNGPVVLAPESFGALIALDYAERRPGRVAGIVFIDGSEPATWFETIKTAGNWQSRLQEHAMGVGWRLGLVRLALPYMEPRWVDALPSPIRGEFRAVFGRPNPGWGDALDAFDRTPVSERPSSAPGSLQAIPVTIIRHGAAASGLGGSFETVWPLAQARLAKLTTSRATIFVAGAAGHEIAQEQPGFVADVIRGAIEAATARTDGG